jgi:D-lactate dehydrogenase (cytochrome)
LNLVAFEFWDGSALQMFKKHGSPKPIMEKEYPFYVLIETSGSNKDHDDEVCKKYKNTCYCYSQSIYLEIKYIS